MTMLKYKMVPIQVRSTESKNDAAFKCSILCITGSALKVLCKKWSTCVCFIHKSIVHQAAYRCLKCLLRISCCLQGLLPDWRHPGDSIEWNITIPRGQDEVWANGFNAGWVLERGGMERSKKSNTCLCIWKVQIISYDWRFPTGREWAATGSGSEARRRTRLPSFGNLDGP